MRTCKWISNIHWTNIGYPHQTNVASTNVGPNMKFRTVGPILKTTIKPILWGNLSCWISELALFWPNIVSGIFQRWINIVWQHINVARQSWNNINPTLYKCVNDSFLYLFTFLIYCQGIMQNIQLHRRYIILLLEYEINTDVSLETTSNTINMTNFLLICYHLCISTEWSDQV